MSKLDAQLLEAEEMLAVKLTTAQRVEDTRGLANELDAWSKEWAAVQPEIRALRQTSERPASAQRNSALLPNLARLVEFIDWNHDYHRSLEGKITALRQATEQDHAVVGKLVDDLLEDSKKMLMLPAAHWERCFQNWCATCAATKQRGRLGDPG